MAKKRVFETVSFYAVALATFLLDQFTKLAIVTAIAFGHSRPLVDGLLHLTHVRNDGAAWSLAAGHVGVLALVSTGVVLGLLAFMHARKPDDPLLVLGVALLVGGALGNLVDRVALGYVRDMIDVRWHGANVFPIFNVADMGVFFGVALLLLQQARQPAGSRLAP